MTAYPLICEDYGCAGRKAGQAEPTADIVQPDRPLETPVLLFCNDPYGGLEIAELIATAGHPVDFTTTPAQLGTAAIRLESAVIALCGGSQPVAEGLRALAQLPLGPPTIVVGEGLTFEEIVDAFRQGAIDVIDFNEERQRLLESLRGAAEQERAMAPARALYYRFHQRVSTLTKRERQVMRRIVAGHANKAVAADLGISGRTVEAHRRRLMDKMEVGSLAELVRIEIILNSGGEMGTAPID